MDLMAGRIDGGLEPRVFDSAELPPSASALAGLVRGVQNADLVAPPVVLPDFHHKREMEMPSSVAVATRDSIRPTLTSASVNCGMALIALDVEPPDASRIEAFFRSVRERNPHPPRSKPVLTAREVRRAATEGAAFAVDRYGFDPALLERIEENGRVALRDDPDLPRLSVHLSRLRFGSIGPTNHFVELQRVEEILDERAAARLGVSLGQTTLHYHAGGGVLTGQVGRLFGRRQKMSKPMKMQMAVQRPLYHLAGARSVSQLRERLALYFSDRELAVDRSDAEGRRLLAANAAAMNYGFAFRAAIYAELCTLADQFFGVRSSRLVVDSPHNSIYEEDVDGISAVVHRHNACRAYPASRFASGTAFGDVGQAVLLPGTHRTSSYLCVAEEGAAASLHSACHGAGTVVDMMERTGASRPHPEGHTTLRFRYGGNGPESAPHLDDRGVDATLDILRSNSIVRPVARMRPVGVLH